MVLLNVLLSGVDRFDTVCFQCAIAFNSPVSVIRGAGGGGVGRWLWLESGDLRKEVACGEDF